MAVDSNLLKGKTEDQKKVIKYFKDTGCLSSFTKMKDEDYDRMVMAKLNSLNLKQRALSKIGLDESEVNEIAPVFFHGYYYRGRYDAAVGKDDRLRSTRYCASWLFFSNTEVYMYRMIFNMDSDSKEENSEEYFYKDITTFSTSNESIDVTKLSGCSGKQVTKLTREYSDFALVVPGAKFDCSTTGVPNAEQSVAGMKQKLREKKM